MPSQNDSQSLSQMFNKLVSSSKRANENTPLVSSPSQQGGINADQLASTGTRVVNETVQKIQRLNQSMPYSFRLMGLVGGLAMIVTNFLSIFGRVLTLNFTGAIISFYCIVFGIVIVLLELDATWSDGRRMQESVRFYAKFLEYTWGRGLFYFFLGTLQFSNWNIVDWCVGGFLMFAGITAGLASIKTARDLRKLRVAIRNESDLKARWKKYDKDGNGYLGIEELTSFIKDAGITMSNNEVVSAYMAMNKNFDDKLSYEELVAWFSRPASGNYDLERLAV